MLAGWLEAPPLTPAAKRDDHRATLPTPGVPIKVLREYERLGFVYTLGRSAGNRRLFGGEALWCVQVVQCLRSLGLTLKEIQTLTVRYTERPSEPIEPLLYEQLAQALARIEARRASRRVARSVAWAPKACSASAARWSSQ